MASLSHNELSEMKITMNIFVMEMYLDMLSIIIAEIVLAEMS